MAPSVLLRPVRESELELLTRLYWDADAAGEYEWFGYRMADAVETVRRWHQDGLVSDDRSYLTVSVDDACAGWVTWRRSDGPATVEIGIALFPDFRGRGIGTQAQRLLVDYLFDTRPVHRVQAQTEIDNVAEQRALERAGFRKEGVLRGVGFRAGRWRDGIIYGVTRDDR
jgi:RimJ/RimL family protein N-acetyltransferase